MKMSEIRRKARELGIKTGGLKKADLIRQIQKEEGNFEYFGTANDYCDQWNYYLRKECLSKLKT